MKKGFWHKRIPNLAAFVLLFGGLWVSLLMIQSGVFFVGQAGPNKIPHNIVISNITDKSFTVSFTTNEKVLSALSVQEGAAPSFLVYDDRNQQNQAREEYLSHFLTVRDLKPNTTYSFSILSDGQIYLNNERAYSITTGGPIVGDPPNQNPVVGNLILGDGAPGNDAIVDLKIDGAQTISVLTEDDGKFTLPTNSIRNSENDTYYSIMQGSDLIITARRQDAISTVRTRYSDTTLIPTITLNRNYDFSDTAELSETATISSQLSIPTPRIGIGEVRIVIPSENQSFVDSRPQFRGTGVARQDVNIVIEDVISTETATDGNGIWTFRPDDSLPPGEHELTIRSRDRFGIPKTVSQTFTIFSAGSQVSQEATPSATPTLAASPTEAPTNSPTPTIIVLPTQEPSPSITIAPTATASPSLSPTLPITPTVVATTAPIASPTPTIIPNITPPSPGSESVIILTFVSVLLIAAGGALLFLL